MKKILIFLLITCANQSSGQDSVKVNDSRFFIGGSFTPEYSYRTIKKDKDLPDDTWEFASNIMDSVEVAKFGYSAGMSFGYYLTNKLSVESGLQFSNKGYKTIPLNYIIDWENPGSYLAVATISYRYYYLDVPLKLNYEFFNNRFQVITGIGVIGNIFLKAMRKITAENSGDDFVNDTDEMDIEQNPVIISGVLSAGVKYNINKKVHIRLEPVFKYALTDFEDNSYISTYLWSVGVQAGVFLKL